jgi:hypothetical protein
MKFIKTVLLGLISVYAFAQESEDQRTCTATCVMPDLYQTEIVSYYIYVGDQENAPHTQKQVIELRPQRKTWKKTPDPDCPSGLAEDCYLWKEVEQAAESMEVTIVTNITKQKDYVIQQLSRERLVRPGGYTEVKEVVCEEDITPAFMHNVSMRLTDMGYYSGLIYSVFNSKIKAALRQFQQHNGLPMGHLDMETLEALDLRVNK